PVRAWCRGADGGEFGLGLFCPRRGADPVQAVQGGAQLRTGVGLAACPAQPRTVQELGASLLERPVVQLQRGEVVLLCFLPPLPPAARGSVRPAPRCQAPRPAEPSPRTSPAAAPPAPAARAGPRPRPGRGCSAGQSRGSGQVLARWFPGGPARCQGGRGPGR